MRCNASPTTSIAARDVGLLAAEATPRKLARHEAATRFAALLFGAALKPMSASLGFFGDVALDATALALARRERALSSTFERLLR